MKLIIQCRQPLVTCVSLPHIHMQLFIYKNFCSKQHPCSVINKAPIVFFFFFNIPLLRQIDSVIGAPTHILHKFKTYIKKEERCYQEQRLSIETLKNTNKNILQTTRKRKAIFSFSDLDQQMAPTYLPASMGREETTTHSHVFVALCQYCQ